MVVIGVGGAGSMTAVADSDIVTEFSAWTQPPAGSIVIQVAFIWASLSMEGQPRPI